MRIALHGYFLSRPYTGSGRYIRQLLDGLTGRSDCSVETLGSPDTPSPSVRVPTPFDPFSPVLGKIWLEAFGLAAAARRRHADLLHIPYLAGSLSQTPPVVATAHDAIPFVLPEYNRSPQVRLYNRLVAAGLRRARLVITDSEASRADLIGAIGLAPDVVRVIPLAADAAFHPNAPSGEAEATRRDFHLPDAFILYLGSVERRKNVTGLLAAYAQARRRGLGLQLVIAASIPPPGGIFPDIRAEMARLGVLDDVILCGPGKPDDTPRLLRTATAFVFPSLYEGFGLPPLEAMACGTPVVCSNRSSLPEVVGDAAILVDPSKPEILADALVRVAADPDLRADLSRRGVERAARFSWRATVDQTVRAYEEVLGRRSREAAAR